MLASDSRYLLHFTRPLLFLLLVPIPSVPVTIPVPTLFLYLPFPSLHVPPRYPCPCTCSVPPSRSRLEGRLVTAVITPHGGQDTAEPLPP